MMPSASEAEEGREDVEWWNASASEEEGREITPRWARRAAEREVTREADDPSPVLLVDWIGLGKGENGDRVVLV